MKQTRTMKSRKSVPDPKLMRQNSILNGLDERTLKETAENCAVSTLKLREKIYTPEEIIRLVHFPIHCVLSVVSQMQDGSQIEIGTIGREGMSAFPLLMGASSTANDSYCQVPGSAVTMSAEVFRNLTRNSQTFRQRLDRYLQAYVNMLGQLAACNRLHSVQQRCARWLLLTHDRVDHDEIPLTQEYLAMMLGTDRSGVTIAAGA